MYLRGRTLRISIPRPQHLFEVAKWTIFVLAFVLELAGCTCEHVAINRLLPHDVRQT